MTAWGYARVSTLHQNLALQLDALEGRAQIPPEYIVTEHASGNAPRPLLCGLVHRMEPGDILTVWRLDRLGRSLSDLLRFADDIHKRGIEIRSLTEQICTATAHGRLVWSLLGALAQYELELGHERMMAGIRSAQARGVRCGRAPKLTPIEERMIFELAMMGSTVRELSKRFAVSTSTIDRALERQRAREGRRSGEQAGKTGGPTSGQKPDE